MLLVVGILPSIGLTAKVGFMPLFTQTLFFGNFSTFFFGRLIDFLCTKLSDEIEVDFNGLRRICNSFVISLMHKNLVDKFVQHHGVQFFKILIFLDQCDEFIGGFLAAFVFVYCFLQGSSFRFKAFLLLGVLGIQNLIPLVREFSEGVVLIDFAD